eukprot:6503349-Pyramimonas_sp.AAC.1
MKLMHLPRTHRSDAAAVSEQFSRGIVELQYERTQNEAADIGAKRFAYPLAWVKVLYLVNVVAPKFWTAQRCRDYLVSMFSDGLPLKPGGALRPRLSSSSALRRGAAVPSKKMNTEKKRLNKGKPAVHSPKPINNPAAPSGAQRPAATDAAPGQAAVANAPGQA